MRAFAWSSRSVFRDMTPARMLTLASVLVAGGCSPTSPKTDRGNDSAAGLRSPATPGAPPSGEPRDARSDAMTQQPGAIDREVESYVEILADESPEGRAPGERWLTEHIDRARPRLHQLAASGKLDLRVAGALRVLGRIGAPEDVAVLLQVAAGSPDTSNGWDAAMALAAHSTPEANAALLELLASSDEATVGNALIALGQRAAEDNRPAIEAKLADPSKRVRFKAVRALAMMGAAPSSAALRGRLAKEADAEVVRAIEAALAPPGR